MHDYHGHNQSYQGYESSSGYNAVKNTLEHSKNVQYANLNNSVNIQGSPGSKKWPQYGRTNQSPGSRSKMQNYIQNTTLARPRKIQI